MARRLGEPSLLPLSLTNLAVLETLRGQPDAARSLYEEPSPWPTRIGRQGQLAARVVGVLPLGSLRAQLPSGVGADHRGSALARESGDRYTMVGAHNMACVLRSWDVSARRSRQWKT
jgi:hypothetical protein